MIQSGGKDGAVAGRGRRGFTLVELLVVVAIIAILSAVALPNLLEAQVRSKVSRAKADLQALSTGLESYAVDHGDYPPDVRLANVAEPWEPPEYELTYMLTVISTPIAYVTTALLPDVFGEGIHVVDESSDFKFTPAIDGQAVYLYDHPGAFLKSVSAQLGGIGWMLRSMGPDHLYHHG